MSDALGRLGVTSDEQKAWAEYFAAKATHTSAVNELRRAERDVDVRTRTLKETGARLAKAVEGVKRFVVLEPGDAGSPDGAT